MQISYNGCSEEYSRNEKYPTDQKTWGFKKKIGFLTEKVIKPKFQASLVAQLIKNPPAVWETWVQSPSWEDPLEKGSRRRHTDFRPGEFYGLYSPWGHKECDTTEQISLHLMLADDIVQNSIDSLNFF